MYLDVSGVALVEFLTELVKVKRWLSLSFILSLNIIFNDYNSINYLL